MTEDERSRVWKAIDDFKDEIGEVNARVSVLDNSVENINAWNARYDDRRHNTEDHLAAIDISIKGIMDKLETLAIKLDALEGLPMKIVLALGSIGAAWIAVAKIVKALLPKIPSP
jgi:archaellum component FlaC